MPGMNEIVASAKGPGAYHRYSKLKKSWTDTVHLLAKARHIPPMQPGVHLQFDWHCQNRRRDPDNIAAGGRKFILDGLVNAGVLPGDGWAAKISWADTFLLDKIQPGTLVTLTKS